MLEIKYLAGLYKVLGPHKETRKLVQLVLTFPITSNKGERSFSFLKRILHNTRCTMTESRLNDHTLMALHPTKLSELYIEKIIEIMFVQANPRKLKL